MAKPPTPEEIKAMSTADLIKKMNELLAELDARNAKQGEDDARPAPGKWGRPMDDG